MSFTSLLPGPVRGSLPALLLAALTACAGAPNGAPGEGPGDGAEAATARAPAEASPAAPATGLTATIHRDAWGAPHVFGETDRDVLYGMAWALAEDDWPLIEGNYLNALGRSAELEGEDAVADDRMARALEIVPLSVAEYEASSPRIRGLLDAYAGGTNAWLAGPGRSEARVLERIEPWYPLALIRFKYYQNEFLGYAGLREEWVERLFEGGWPVEPGGPGDGASAGTAHASRPASPWEGSEGEEAADPSPLYGAARMGPAGERPLGSNQWAVAPSRTRDGRALLLINPHQSFVGVQRYAEIHLDSREGLRFSGLTVFGFLLPYMGHNDRLGWAYTDNYADHSDLWGEVFDHPTDPLRYRYGEEYRTAETWTDSIRVRTDGGLETRTFRFWKTHHGPVVGVADDGRPLAVRLARMEGGGWFTQWDRMIRARSLEEWRGAMAMLRVAYMNAMYADADGNIGYVYGSAVPRRLEGVDPSGILDGSDPRTEWQGFHGLDELPQVFNPASGWLVNTNSSPFTAAPDLPFGREDFPAYMVGREGDNARAQSSRRVLEATRGVTFEDFAERVWDSRLEMADSVIALLERRVEALGAEGPGRHPVVAVELLGLWDRRSDTASVETTWAVLTAELLARRPGSPTPEAALEAFARALAMLAEEWGTTRVPWGWLNRHQRPLPGAAGAGPVQALRLDPDRPSLAVGGAPGFLGSIFTYNTERFAEARPGLGRHGNSFVKVIEFGPEPRAASILNYGQSGDPESPHFFDQAELYSERRFKPAFFTREEVEAEAVRRYTVPR